MGVVSNNAKGEEVKRKPEPKSTEKTDAKGEEEKS